MEKISKISSHTNKTYYLLTINAFHRAAFYGIKTMLIAYLVSQTFNKSAEEAISYVSNLTSLYILCRVVGALIGDLVLGNKFTAVLGGILQTIGILCLLIPQQTFMYLSIGLIALGSGAFSANLNSIFGQMYLKKSRLLDGAFTLFYTSIHIGALLGILIIGGIGFQHFQLGLVLAASLAAISTWLMITQKPTNIPERYQNRYLQYSSRKTYIFLTILFVSLFWLIYEFASSNLPELQMKFNENTSFNSISTSWFSSISDFFVILLGLLFSAIWSYYYISSFVKVSIGFLITAAAFLILLALPETNLDAGGSNVILSLLLLSLGELFIAPVLASAITKLSNPKYLAISISLAKLPTLFLASLCTLIPSWIRGNGLLTIKLTVAIFASFAILSYLLFTFIKIERLKRSLSEE